MQYSRIGEKYFAVAGFTATREGETKRSGESFYQPGLSIDINATYGIVIGEKYQLSISGIYSQRGKDKTLDPFTGVFGPDQEKSAGATYFVSTTLSRAIDEKSRIKGMAEYLQVNRNNFDIADDRFIPTRQKYTGGIGYDYELEKGKTISTEMKYYRMVDDSVQNSSKIWYSGGVIRVFYKVAFSI